MLTGRSTGAATRARRILGQRKVPGGAESQRGKRVEDAHGEGRDAQVLNFYGQSRPCGGSAVINASKELVARVFLLTVTHRHTGIVVNNVPRQLEGRASSKVPGLSASG